MIKPILLLIILFLPHFEQDVKVATWSTGAPETAAYESLSFWVKENRRAYVRYTHGTDADDVELSWQGPDNGREGKGFQVLFPAPDTLRLTVVPDGYDLKVSDHEGKYRKVFHWENESKPAPGDTTGCSICAKDEKEAMKWLQTYFMH